jgi:hypothetical protein
LFASTNVASPETLKGWPLEKSSFDKPPAMIRKRNCALMLASTRSVWYPSGLASDRPRIPVGGAMKKDKQQTGQQQQQGGQPAPIKAKAPASNPSTVAKGGVEKKKAKQSPAAKAVASGGAAAKAASEIDDIFGQAAAKSKQQKEHKPVASKEAEPSKVSPPCAVPALMSAHQNPTLLGALPLQKAPKVEGSKDDIFGEHVGKGRKKTEEGFNIYTEEELGLNKPNAGMTDLCPFDCDCCF